MGGKGEEPDMFKQFEEESDAFFDQLLSDAGVASPAPPGAAAAAPAAASAPLAASAAAAAPAAAGSAGPSPPKAASAAKPPGPTPAPTSKASAPAAPAPPAKAAAATAAGEAPPKAAAGQPVATAPAAAAAPAAAEAQGFDPPPRRKGSAEIEAEYAQLSRQLQGGQAAPSPAKAGTSAGVGSAAQTFDLASDSDDVEVETEVMHLEQQRPEIPPAQEHFTQEDLALRRVLIDFYLGQNADNLSNINAIISKYGGRRVSHLWASLALKYNVPAREAIELLSCTLYHGAPFEYADEEHAKALEDALQELRRGGGEGSAATGPSNSAGLLRKAIQRGAGDGSDSLLRVLCFRGVPDESGLRPQVWKVLLGYLPMARHSEWGALQGEKRALYASYKSELLSVGEDHQVEVRETGAKTAELQELLQEIKNDVDRTRRDFEFFRRPATCGALLALLFVYARLNPGVRYVQGMNEVAAVVLWVMSVDPECAEADTFWCFSELMVEIKEGFMQALDNTGEGVYGLVQGVTRLLRSYDPELARHLQRCELPPVIFLVRWCTVLFAQDATLPDIVRLWDSFVADPRRFEFVIYICLALILTKREELLRTEKQFELAETLQGAPRASDMEDVRRRACAICAFERRAQTPPFPPPPKAQVVEDLSEWAQTAAAAAQEAAAKAQEVSAEVTRNLQENVAPVVLERATQASAAAAVAATDGAQAIQHWFEETAPARKEAIGQAQTHLTSFWDTVRATSAAAAEKGTKLAEEYRQSEEAKAATARLSGVAGAASSLWARTAAAAAAFAAEPSAAAAGGPAPAAAASAASGGSPAAAAAAKEAEAPARPATTAAAPPPQAAAAAGAAVKAAPPAGGGTPAAAAAAAAPAPAPAPPADDDI